MARKNFLENVKNKIESNGWVYFIGSDGLRKARLDGSEMRLLYKCNTTPSFCYDYLKYLLKVDEEWVYFTVQGELYRESDDPDDPYSERSSYVLHIDYKIKLDGSELTKTFQSVCGVGTFSEP